jgi:hypothetical protein
MRQISAEEIQNNWIKLMDIIDKYISEPRKTQLKDFYKKHEERITLMPAAHKREYHNAFPGGYVEHVIRVVNCALKLYKVWEEEGASTHTFTIEELVFSALNHDLGKMGDENHEAYILQTDQWRKDKLGEDYTFNSKLEFCSIPDRGLFLLHDAGIKYSFNEMLAILTHDGLYDEANKKYLISWSPEQKPRTSLIYILHQADLMAARIEWEMDWLEDLNKGKKSQEIKTQPVEKPKKPFSLDKSSKALKTVGNINIENFLDKI